MKAKINPQLAGILTYIGLFDSATIVEADVRVVTNQVDKVQKLSDGLISFGISYTFLFNQRLGHIVTIPFGAKMSKDV